jgi:dGTPase
VIGFLLRSFVGAVLNPQSSKSKKLLLMIPEQFVLSKQKDSLYSDLLSVVSFIAGMTDLYAVDMYRKLTGMNFPML